MPTQWSIYFACIHFFLFLSFLTMARETIISGSTLPIFALFLPDESILGADDHMTSFQYLNGHCHENQFCGKMANSPHLLLWHSETKWVIAT